ncbi:hypothetical protein GCM10011386_33240 [Parapedobacter defluvii]|uniref:HTTM-like domain-containing protein n=1 Tax=Parapedobacter defluvii TaxID=2045106 RepID=A0ABQ1MEP4_9SPHI|nr:hypothetical protein [Parapedobacter defluvii]GGC38493.1 hypothetical protein GCM10011386_33240 [Parapedobacter defluvii]
MLTHFFFKKPVGGNYLQLLRIGTGSVLLFAVLELWPDFDALYGPDGVLPHSLVMEIQSAVGLSYPTILQEIHSVTAWPYAVLTHGTVTLYAILCILLAFARRLHRIVAAALLLLHSSLFTVQPLYSYGFDFLGSVALFYCLLAPRRPSSSWARPWLRVLQLHLCLIYFFSGAGKALGHTWRNGAALYKALGVPAMPPLLPLDTALPTLGEYPFAFAIGGWAVIILELGYAAGIWWRRTYSLFLYGAISLHAAIALLLGLYHFSLLMIVFNYCAFWTDPPAQYGNRQDGTPEAAKSTSTGYRPVM